MLDLIDLDSISQERCTAGFNQVKNCCNSKVSCVSHVELTTLSYHHTNRTFNEML